VTYALQPDPSASLPYADGLCHLLVEPSHGGVGCMASLALLDGVDKVMAPVRIAHEAITAAADQGACSRKRKGCFTFKTPG